MLIGTSQTSQALYPGEFEDVTLEWTGPTPGTVFVTVNEIYAQYFEEPFPTRSAIQAGALPKGALVEIDAIALVG